MGFHLDGKTSPGDVHRTCRRLHRKGAAGFHPIEHRASTLHDSRIAIVIDLPFQRRAGLRNGDRTIAELDRLARPRHVGAHIGRERVGGPPQPQHRGGGGGERGGGDHDPDLVRVPRRAGAGHEPVPVLGNLVRGLGRPQQGIDLSAEGTDLVQPRAQCGRGVELRPQLSPGRVAELVVEVGAQAAIHIVVHCVSSSTLKPWCRW